MIDPSGHIAVCFNGGYKNTGTEASEETQTTTANKVCTDALADAGYDPSIHGEVHHLQNGASGINRAVELILEAAQNGDQPIIIFGYSWGGAAALKTAQDLSFPKPVGSEFNGDRFVPVYSGYAEIDALILVDPELEGRMLGATGLPRIRGYERSKLTPRGIPDNVKYSSILNAEHPTPYTGLQRIGTPLQNGSTVHGASSEKTLRSVNGLAVDHHSIVENATIAQYTTNHISSELGPVVTAWNIENLPINALQNLYR